MDPVAIIFERMDEKGIRYTWLADKLGVHRSVLTHMKHGRRQMPAEMVAEAFELLDIPTAMLRSLPHVATDVVILDTPVTLTGDAA